jgi:DNA-binding beta-propeller fold protein YncE
MGTTYVGPKLSRPMRRRNMYIMLVAIFLVEAALFAYFYLSKTDPLATMASQLPGTSAPTFQYNIYGPINDPMNKPMGVVVVNKQIYVTDTNHQKVRIFDYDGNPLSNFGTSGTKEGQFRFPYGIASDAQGQLYIADLYNANISIFSSDGKFIKYFGKKGDFVKPAGLAIDGNKIYISDVDQNKILVYDLDGNKLLTFGTKGVADGQLNSPNAVIHVGSKIYVSDTGNDRLQVFDDQGKFLLKATSELANPRGICVDPQGNFYTVSNLTNKVVAFNPKGERLFTFGGVGSDDGLFTFPNGLFRDSQGRFYITDVGNARVSIFQ